MTEIELGWLAGIMDGEGTVTLTKCYGKKRNRFRQPTLSITSTDLEILLRVKELAGGTICRVSKYRNRMKQAWIWCRNGARVVFDIIRQIGPHMACPKKKLRIAFLLENYEPVTNRGGQYTDEMRVAKTAFEEKFFLL